MITVLIPIRQFIKECKNQKIKIIDKLILSYSVTNVSG